MTAILFRRIGECNIYLLDNHELNLTTAMIVGTACSLKGRTPFHCQCPSLWWIDFLLLGLRGLGDIFEDIYMKIYLGRNGKQMISYVCLLQIVSSDEYINPVLQNLCADALLSISDEDSDWELNITEFMKCLDPGELEKCLHVSGCCTGFQIEHQTSQVSQFCRETHNF